MKRTWREGSFTGDPKNMVSKSLEMGVYFHRGRLLGNTKRKSFSRAFDRREKFLYLGKCLMRDLRDM
jgi:hypothetical protein